MIEGIYSVFKFVNEKKIKKWQFYKLLTIGILNLEALHSDFNKWFEDIFKMYLPDWVLDPFSNTETKNSTKLEKEFFFSY